MRRLPDSLINWALHPLTFVRLLVPGGTSSFGTLNAEYTTTEKDEETGPDESEEQLLEFNVAFRADPDEADERQSSQQSLLSLLEEFRSGNMRALNDESLGRLRDMQKQQLELHRLHTKLHQIMMLNPLESSTELDKEFDRLNDVLLKGLHTSMQNFTAST
ncbi:hypothetical protein L596_007956 [Steinernema carpocapsae]|uniref:Uncharacterized protein n=1 Tax=Steinernema carpocapsae TaxID=34508 RepID=A0A4U5PB71_STECR|nr:hypothetical protein L596_007956 [Steinernema carpocapsae]